MTHTGTRWPWHIKVTHTDGTVKEDDYSSNFGAVGFAEYASKRPDVARVELSVTFVAGEAASPLVAAV